MSKWTRYTLKAMIPVVGICVPIIVILNIVREGNYWSLLHLVWGYAVIFFAGVLLTYSRQRGTKGER